MLEQTLQPVLLLDLGEFIGFGEPCILGFLHLGLKGVPQLNLDEIHLLFLLDCICEEKHGWKLVFLFCLSRAQRNIYHVGYAREILSILVDFVNGVCPFMLIPAVHFVDGEDTFHVPTVLRDFVQKLLLLLRVLPLEHHAELRVLGHGLGVAHAHLLLSCRTLLHLEQNQLLLERLLILFLDDLIARCLVI